MISRPTNLIVVPQTSEHIKRIAWLVSRHRSPRLALPAAATRLRHVSRPVPRPRAPQASIRAINVYWRARVAAGKATAGPHSARVEGHRHPRHIHAALARDGESSQGRGAGCSPGADCQATAGIALALLVVPAAESESQGPLPTPKPTFAALESSHSTPLSIKCKARGDQTVSAAAAPPVVARARRRLTTLCRQRSLFCSPATMRARHVACRFPQLTASWRNGTSIRGAPCRLHAHRTPTNSC
jgi:hypothetical protein